MSEVDESLLGHRSDLVVHWQHEGDRHHNRKGRNCALALVATLLFTLSAFTIYFLWNSTLKATETSITYPHSPAAVPEPEGDLRFSLHAEDHVSREPGVRIFAWNITKGTIAPDGVQKDVFLINNQFPGPTIEARPGDILEIEVFNLLDEGVSLHWHGLHMRGANHMDGPVGITQCPIRPGEKFLYRVPIDDQVGTFWYHAHSEVQRGDGLYGGIVIHNSRTPEDISRQYEKELLFLVGDWYHLQAADVLSKFLSRTSIGHEPCPDSMLVNGHGYFECSMAVPAAPVNCTEVEKPWLSLDKQYRYRIRLINVGSLTGISFTIPDAEISVIQVDGGRPVISHVANSVGVLYPAERVDFVVSWSESVIDADSEIIIALDTEYFLQPNFALTSTQSFLLSTESPIRRPANNETEIIQFKLRDAKGPPLTNPLPDAEKSFVLYTVVQVLAHQNSIPKGFINHTTWEPQNLPLVALDRSDWDDHQLVPWTGPRPIWVDLTINNIDGTGHPFHLHGFDFYVVSTYEGNGGWDYYNPFDQSKAPRGGPFNLVDPISKDTVYVPPYGYVVIRFLADNEGIWMLHCHILWHQASGMSMAFQVLGDERDGLSKGIVGSTAKKHCAV